MKKFSDYLEMAQMQINEGGNESIFELKEKLKTLKRKSNLSYNTREMAALPNQIQKLQARLKELQKVELPEETRKVFKNEFDKYLNSSNAELTLDQLQEKLEKLFTKNNLTSWALQHTSFDKFIKDIQDRFANEIFSVCKDRFPKMSKDKILGDIKMNTDVTEG